jgi:hypothetical protein
MALLLSLGAEAQEEREFHRTPTTRTSLAVEAEWTLGFELAFGDSSPYSSRFPSLYDDRLPYEVRRAITMYVLDRIIPLALRETGAKRAGLAYRPGGYQDFPVVPSAQLTVRATEAKASRALSIIGYLAQQTAVIGSKKSSAGNRPALEIVERVGRRLREREALEKFWRRLAALSPKLGPGFSSIERGGRPGIYIIDSDGDWKTEDFPQFNETIHAVSKEFRIETIVHSLTVEYLEIGNDWKTHAGGASYLERLGESGRFGLRRRLVTQYQPQVERWIARAFRKYAPAIFKEKSAGERTEKNTGESASPEWRSEHASLGRVSPPVSQTLLTARLCRPLCLLQLGIRRRR